MPLRRLGSRGDLRELPGRQQQRVSDYGDDHAEDGADLGSLMGEVSSATLALVTVGVGREWVYSLHELISVIFQEGKGWSRTEWWGATFRTVESFVSDI